MRCNEMGDMSMPCGECASRTEPLTPARPLVSGWLGGSHGGSHFVCLWRSEAALV